MKLLIQEVQDHGPLDLEETIPAERMDHPALKSPIRLHVHAECLGDEVLALIKAETSASLECARCLEGFEKPLKATVTLHAPLSNQEVEAGDEARQSLHLALPVKPLCRPDCKGLCAICGTNLNAGPCTCAPEAEDSPFTKLKDLKL